MSADDHQPAASQARRPVASWPAAYTCEPDRSEPLLLAACPARPYPQPGSVTSQHIDAWYCRESLGMAAYCSTGTPAPQLPLVRLNLLAHGAQVSVAGRPWLEIPQAPPRTWPGVLQRRCRLTICFTGRDTPADSRTLRAAIAAGNALTGEIAVGPFPGVWRTREGWPWLP